MQDQEIEFVDAICHRAERMLEEGAATEDILNSLVAAAEHISAPGAVSSILVLDTDGLLRNGASPNLPDDYLLAIDRLRPSPDVGTCAAAAATGCIVITTDFHADEKWAELRHLPLSLGFLSAWSMPIKSSKGDVLGTFGTYFRESRQPTNIEVQAMQRLAVAAARTLEPAVL